MDVFTEGSGEKAAADIALCKAVHGELERAYPGHCWMVGANHEAGTVTIDLPFDKPWKLRNYGMLLHIPSVMDDASARKVRRAGGELLERFGVARGPATAEARAAAAEHGLETDGAVIRSRF